MPIPVTALILAADSGGPDAAIHLPFRGRTLLRHAAETALRSQAEQVAVLLHSADTDGRRELEGLNLTIIDSSPEGPALLGTGLQAVAGPHRALLLLEANQPFLSAELLDALLLRHDAEPEPIISSLCRGRRTLPAVVPRSFFPVIEALPSIHDIAPYLGSVDGMPTIPFPEGEKQCRREDEPCVVSPISTIIFDFGMVISSFEVAQFLRNLVPYTGKSMTELKHILGVVRDIVIEYETGLMSTDDFVSRVFAATNLPLTREQFRDAYTNIFTPITSTHDLIRRLKPHYHLGLLSNTSEWHFEHAIRTAPVFPLFDAITLSYEVKALKPSRNIYDDMLAKIHARPHECIYIDDIEENTRTAAWLGMEAIQYRNHEQLVSDLRRIGVTI